MTVILKILNQHYRNNIIWTCKNIRWESFNLSAVTLQVSKRLKIVGVPPELSTLCLGSFYVYGVFQAKTFLSEHEYDIKFCNCRTPIVLLWSLNKRIDYWTDVDVLSYATHVFCNVLTNCLNPFLIATIEGSGFEDLWEPKIWSLKRKKSKQVN